MCSSMPGAAGVIFTSKFWKHTQSVVSLSPCIFSRKHGKHKSVCLQVVCAPLDFAIFVRMIMTHMMFSICSTNPFYAVELVVGQLETKDNGPEEVKLEDVALSRSRLSRDRSSANSSCASLVCGRPLVCLSHVCLKHDPCLTLCASDRKMFFVEKPELAHGISITCF